MISDRMIDAYFARIGFAGRGDATLATLKALHRLHPSEIGRAHV